MALDKASDFPDVFRHFAVAEGERPDESCYPYAPVFPIRIDGNRAVIKRTTGPMSAAAAIARWVRALDEQGVEVVNPLTLIMDNPAEIGDRVWVVYPWIEGRTYQGSTADIEAAGDLLGRIHAAQTPDDDMPRFPWPDHDAASVEEDVTGLQRVLGKHAPEIHDEVLARMTPWLESFMAETLPPVRDADLPRAVVCMDYKANNLVYVNNKPVLIDPDNAEFAPRILDLALAALLFQNESATSPPRLFTTAEWATFMSAYGRHVRLTDTEVTLWPTVLRYMLLEWGTWTLIDAAEWDDWEDAHKRGFLVDLATVDLEKFPLPNS
ncbi:phosphotransferase [Nonomuraea jabiensis]|uniref:Ser/Thr protein kinase RdoA (MazF antagonist) n=1 Tax=Nonomuraea jabiensis TaxID=882448 RepID=A0A7W9L7K1_9ACTN|nr:phosphotransferase [Nonomuraea jabiensis]MBB5773563.1 Ser/Thr protein kinase RdoA (MazF antagonist) [Nonomuraea jabiensis]